MEVYIDNQWLIVIAYHKENEVLWICSQRFSTVWTDVNGPEKMTVIIYLYKEVLPKRKAHYSWPPYTIYYIQLLL
jgi:hypothetical protein